MFHWLLTILLFIIKNRSSNALFELAWQGDGSVCFRANNGKYVSTKRSGHLYANVDAIDEACKYFFYLINRYLYYIMHWCTIIILVNNIK